MSAKPIPVNWVRSDELECRILGGMGLSTKCIMERTGLTHSQVTYRLHKAGVKRKDYRDGTSDMAHLVIDRLLPRSIRGMRGMIGL